MLVDLPIHAFLEETKSSSPTPGGGSASALAGALGAALGIMVANLTEGKEEPGGDLARFRADLESLLTTLEGYVDKDAEAFNGVMAAYKLPKATETEKTARRQAIQSATKAAADLPLAAAESCLRVLALAADLIEIGNPNAASDGAVAGALAYAGLWGAVYNVRINIAALRDEAFVLSKRKEIARLLASGEELLGRLRKRADEKTGA
jgi:formiminotetrahydrofolate cyclodeaminase